MSDLNRLFYWCGVSADYYNYRGEHVEVPLENRLSLLKAMGIDVDDQAVVHREAYKLDVEPWHHWFSKLSLATSGEHVSVEINLKPDDIQGTLDWRLSDLEGNHVRSGTVTVSELEETGEYLDHGTHYSRRRINLGALAPNYYRLNVLSEQRSGSTTLAVCPEKGFQPEWSGEQPWGVLVQLYTLRSKRNWGIGDFTDLRELIELASAQGAGAIGLNPLHVLSHDLDVNYSPYSPSDRRFINPLYIDPVWIPEFNAQIKLSVDRAVVSALRESPKVDYVAVRALKYPVFQRMFTVFIEKELTVNSKRFQDFRRYVEAEGAALIQFARYEATHQDWPYAVYRLVDDDARWLTADSIFDGHESEHQAILFHCYLQWLAQKQLSDCQVAAKSSGMTLGLMRDLAVGANGAGAEVSNNSKVFCRGASVGAPPDPLAQKGQNWGLPPMLPAALRKTGFEPFITLLRANMRHCGVLRIDHVMSLMRLWWCPPEQNADQGAYVYYPFKELIGLLALESHLNQCLIVGEDLGVVPDEFRCEMAARGFLSNKILYFEREDDGFRLPENYGHNALAMATNHDVPTLASWWNGSDLKIRNTLNILEEGVTYEDARKERRRDKTRLLEALSAAGEAPSEWLERSVDDACDQALVDAILLFASKSVSRLFLLQLEDLISMDMPVNVPGTFREFPNWQRKLEKSTKDILRDDRVAALLKQIHERRGQTAS